MEDAAVVCRQLNCGTPIQAKYNAYFGTGQGQIWQSSVNCSGMEEFFSDCPMGENNCASNHNKDAGVICSGNLFHFNFL